MGITNLQIYDPNPHQIGEEFGIRIPNKMVKVYYKVRKIIEDNLYEVEEVRISRLIVKGKGGSK